MGHVVGLLAFGPTLLQIWTTPALSLIHVSPIISLQPSFLMRVVNENRTSPQTGKVLLPLTTFSPTLFPCFLSELNPTTLYNKVPPFRLLPNTRDRLKTTHLSRSLLALMATYGKKKKGLLSSFSVFQDDRSDQDSSQRQSGESHRSLSASSGL